MRSRGTLLRGAGGETRTAWRGDHVFLQGAELCRSEPLGLSGMK